MIPPRYMTPPLRARTVLKTSQCFSYRFQERGFCYSERRFLISIAQKTQVSNNVFTSSRFHAELYNCQCQTELYIHFSLFRAPALCARFFPTLLFRFPKRWMNSVSRFLEQRREWGGKESKISAPSLSSGQLYFFLFFSCERTTYLSFQRLLCI